MNDGLWINTSRLDVGSSGMGTLIVNGGLLSSSASYIGYLPGANGTATVTNGTWTNSSSLYVGFSGTGTLTLGGNGLVSVGSGTGTVVLAAGATTGVGTLNLGGTDGGVGALGLRHRSAPLLRCGPGA